MKRQAFTLIEMLVVVAIIGICVAVTIPSFVEAQRGAALRGASQKIIMTAKYARSMSILKQVDMALLVDKGAAQIELVTLTQPPGSDDQSKFIDQRATRALNPEESSSDSAAGLSDTNNVPPPPVIKSELVRDLDAGITVKELEVMSEQGGRDRDVSWVFFSRNGTSSGFKILIEDQRANACEIEMDAISGLVKSRMIDRKQR